MGQLASGAFDGMGTGVFPGGSMIRPATFTYNFAVHGGATSSIIIGSLSAGTRVLGGYMDVQVAPVGAGASIGVTLEAAGDIVAVAAIAGAPWSTTGLKAIVPKRNTPETTSVLTTVDRNLLFVISAVALTAGRVVFYLEVQNAA